MQQCAQKARAEKPDYASAIGMDLEEPDQINAIRMDAERVNNQAEWGWTVSSFAFRPGNTERRPVSRERNRAPFAWMYKNDLSQKFECQP